MYVPAVLGAILVSTLPFSNKVGLLFSYWISSELPPSLILTFDHNSSVFAIAPFTIFLGWVGSTTAGHTKRESISSSTSSRSLTGHLQASPQMPSCSALMRSETPLVSSCGSHSTSHGRIHSALLPTALSKLQEPCSMGCHHCHQFYFRSHPPRVTFPILA